MQINVIESLAERVRFEHEASVKAASVSVRASATTPRAPARPIVLRLEETSAAGTLRAHGGSDSARNSGSASSLLSSLPSARGSRLRATKEGSASTSARAGRDTEPVPLSGAMLAANQALPHSVSARPGTAGS